jgi:hypothetical protein
MERTVGGMTVLLSVLILGPSFTAWKAQTPTVRAETNLVLVRFHVLAGDRYLTDIQKDEVEVLENGERREVSVFEGPSTPTRSRSVHLVVALDVSGSVTPYRPLTSSLLGATVMALMSVRRFPTVRRETRHLAGPTHDSEPGKGGQTRKSLTPAVQESSTRFAKSVRNWSDQPNSGRSWWSSPMVWTHRGRRLDMR